MERGGRRRSQGAAKSVVAADPDGGPRRRRPPPPIPTCSAARSSRGPMLVGLIPEFMTWMGARVVFISVLGARRSLHAPETRAHAARGYRAAGARVSGAATHRTCQ